MTRGEERKEYMRAWYLSNKERHTVSCYDWKNKNPEKVKESAKKWRDNNKEKRLELQRNWRASNKDRTNEYDRKYYWQEPEKKRANRHRRYWADPEKYRKRARDWSKAHPEAGRVSALNYSASKRNAEGTFTAADIKDLYATQGGSCYYCSVDIEGGYHIEHMVPLSRGGRNDVSNICLSCAPCNLRKHTKTAEEFKGESHV